MFFTCKCLNITLEVREAEPRANLRRELRLSTVEELDNFFKEDIKEVKLINATKYVPSLVQERRVGCWIISHCLNCTVNCYATTLDKRVTLINSILIMTQDAITNLQKNRDFSPAFNIIVQPVADVLVPPGPAPTGNLKNVLTSLQHQLRDSIRNQIRKTEESIRIFSEELYDKLEDFQNRATKDHKALAHKAREVHVPGEEGGAHCSKNAETGGRKLAKKSSKKRRARKIKKSRASPAPVELQEAECQDRQTSPCPINAQPTVNEPIPPSLDSEGLFYLEGMEEDANDSSEEAAEGEEIEVEVGEEEEEEEEGEEEEEQPEEQEEEVESEDSESHDEGIDVQHEQTPSSNIAKSLPVEIPPHPPHVYEDKDEVPVQGIDIAASIKALARSVRGDTVFGELPPPRLSTGI